MPTKRPREPIAPTTIPGQPLDPKIPPDQQADSDEVESTEDDDVGTDKRGNEMLSMSLRRLRPDTRPERTTSGNAQFGAVPGAKRQIPDRSEEPAVQESLDEERSTTAANSSDAATDVPPETRDDEGNAVEAEANRKEMATRARPDPA